jgi:hypothetical protein
MNTRRTQTADLNPTATAGDLTQWLSTVPDDARISFHGCG